MKNTVTTRDIAEASGYNQSTVSRALRNDAKINEATRKKIQEVAEALGYRPDPVLSALAMRRRGHDNKQANTITYVGNFGNAFKHAQEGARKGIRVEAEAMGYIYDEFDLSEYQDHKWACSILYNRGSHGIIVGPTLQEDAKLEIDWDLFYGVQCHLGFNEPEQDTVLPDMYNAMRLVWEQLWAHGYRRIGFAMPGGGVNFRDSYKISAFLFCENHYLGAGHHLPIFKGLEADSGAFFDWFEKEQPEVIIGMNNTSLKWLTERGVSVPEEVGFVSLRCVDNSDVTGIVEDLVALGRSAMHLLDSKIRNNLKGLLEQLTITSVGGRWHSGNTIRNKH